MPNSSAAARKNMVDCQIHTAGVIAPPILEAFGEVPREIFVPESLKSVAYADEDLPLGQGRFLLAPPVLAKMIHAASIDRSDRILDIGGATGYSGAILSALSEEVVALDESAALLDKARKNWDSLGIRNVEAHAGIMREGLSSRAPYDVIFINGAVAEIPERLADQLAPGGRVMAVLARPDGTAGQAVVAKSSGKGGFSALSMFYAASPYVPGFEPSPAFQF